MEIREASTADILGIVSLLKISLGESLMPKSEAYWKWKHLDNPFGASPVLLALENNTIIGVRAFMRWKWEAEGKIVEAVRAVDTATHPEHQGKGIFSKLTTSLLMICSENALDMVFNTPNEKSLPGYLKMGWVKAGRLPVTLKVNRPLAAAAKFFVKNPTHFTESKDSSVSYYLSHQSLPKLLDQTHRTSSVYKTKYSLEYLWWRYEKVPVSQYFAAGIENEGNLTGLAFYRLKNTRLGKELRVTDVFYYFEDDLKKLELVISEKIRFHKAHFTTFSNPGANMLAGFLTINSKQLGPIVTVRDIKKEGVSEFINFQKWSPSLGDLELF